MTDAGRAGWEPPPRSRSWMAAMPEAMAQPELTWRTSGQTLMRFTRNLTTYKWDTFYSRRWIKTCFLGIHTMFSLIFLLCLIFYCERNFPVIKIFLDSDFKWENGSTFSTHFSKFGDDKNERKPTNFHIIQFYFEQSRSNDWLQLFMYTNIV